MLAYIGQYSAEALGKYTPWIKPEEILNLQREQPIGPIEIGGRNDHFRIQYQYGSIYNDWARYESCQAVDGSLNKPDEGISTCIVYVDKFWLKDDMYNTGTYSFNREDGFPIPLAATFELVRHGENQWAEPVFKIFCLPAYPAMKGIGASVSPLILDESCVEIWLEPQLEMEAKNVLLKTVPAFLFHIDRVDEELLQEGHSAALDTVRRHKKLSEL